MAVDLEAEFRMLRSMCIQKIEEKKNAGLLTEDEAEELNDMILDRMIPSDEDLYDGDEGWSASQRCW